MESFAELHRKLESNIPKLPKKAEPEKITAHQQALAKAIQTARAGAKQGDLFFPEVRPILRNAVRSETEGANGAEARKEIVETAGMQAKGAETPAPVKLAVNTLYPGGVSLSTVPPELLRKLPTLPDELDYRFVGRHLILRAVSANLIVDVLPDALPPRAPRTSNKK